MAQVAQVQGDQGGYPLDGFENDLSKVLVAKGRKDPAISDLTRVNEEDLFATVMYRELKGINAKAAEEFMTELPAAITKLLGTKGIVLVYKAADRIARDLVRRGRIAQEVFKDIKKKALGLAQLDGDKTWLDTKRNEAATGSDTPLRSVKTAKASLVTNQSLTEDQYALFRDREAQISKAKWKERVKGE